MYYYILIQHPLLGGLLMTSRLNDVLDEYEKDNNILVVISDEPYLGLKYLEHIVPIFDNLKFLVASGHNIKISDTDYYFYKIENDKLEKLELLWYYVLFVKDNTPYILVSTEDTVAKDIQEKNPDYFEVVSDYYINLQDEGDLNPVSLTMKHIQQMVSMDNTTSRSARLSRKIENGNSFDLLPNGHIISNN